MGTPNPTPAPTRLEVPYNCRRCGKTGTVTLTTTPTTTREERLHTLFDLTEKAHGPGYCILLDWFWTFPPEW